MKIILRNCLYCLYIWAFNIIGQPPKPRIDLVNYFIDLSDSVYRIMNIELKSNSLWLDMLPFWQSSSSLTSFLTYFLLGLSLDHRLVKNFLATKVKLFDNPSQILIWKENNLKLQNVKIPFWIKFLMISFIQHFPILISVS